MVLAHSQTRPSPRAPNYALATVHYLAAAVAAVAAEPVEAAISYAVFFFFFFPFP